MKVYLNKKPDSSDKSFNIFLSHLVKKFNEYGASWTLNPKDSWNVGLACISLSDPQIFKRGPIVQRLDGIYLNTDDASMKNNSNIKQSYRQASGVIFQSGFCRDVISANWGLPKVPYTVIHNGTYVDKNANGEEFLKEYYRDVWDKVSKYKVRMICVASWRQVKRATSIIKGAAEYTKQNPDSCLLVVGDIKPEEKYECSLIGKNVIFLDRIPHNHVKYFHLISHVCLNLSFMDACPNAVIEAMAYGVPCVVTRYQGVVELMGEKDGVIIKSDLDWDYTPISAKKYFREVDPVEVGKAIEKCVEIGRGPLKENLDISNTTQGYLNFLGKIARK